MESTINEHDIIHHDKKLGFITKNEVILYKKDREEKIDIQSVNNVQLVKTRVFYFNLLLLIGSAIIFYFTYFIYPLHSILASALFVAGCSTLLYAFYHKYYHYTIVIKDKDKTTHQLKTTQVNRDNIKKFYFKIAKRVDRKKINIR